MPHTRDAVHHGFWKEDEAKSLTRLLKQDVEEPVYALSPITGRPPACSARTTTRGALLQPFNLQDTRNTIGLPRVRGETRERQLNIQRVEAEKASAVIEKIRNARLAPFYGHGAERAAARRKLPAVVDGDFAEVPQFDTTVDSGDMFDLAGARVPVASNQLPQEQQQQQKRPGFRPGTLWRVLNVALAELQQQQQPSRPHAVSTGWEPLIPPAMARPATGASRTSSTGRVDEAQWSRDDGASSLGRDEGQNGVERVEALAKDVVESARMEVQCAPVEHVPPKRSVLQKRLQPLPTVDERFPRNQPKVVTIAKESNATCAKRAEASSIFNSSLGGAMRTVMPAYVGGRQIFAPRAPRQNDVAHATLPKAASDNF